MPASLVTQGEKYPRGNPCINLKSVHVNFHVDIFDVEIRMEFHKKRFQINTWISTWIFSPGATGNNKKTEKTLQFIKHKSSICVIHV